MAARGCRLGIDVGGTFTDLVLARPDGGGLVFYKEPSTPDDPSAAIENGVTGILAKAELAAGAIELVVHGTTLGLNTIIQRRGAKVAVVVSRGNRDVMEIARSRLPSSYNLRVVKEESLVPRDLVFEIDARTLASGAIDRRPEAAEIAAVAERIRGHGVSAVAVMLLNSYLHPQQEQEVAAALREALGGTVLVTESAAIWPEIREYERLLLATLNAYIHPLLDRYFGRLQERLERIGVAAPIYITANNGGSLGLATARQRPIDTVLSGPASGVVATARLAGLGGVGGTIAFDMGGTSSDMAVSVSGEPEYSTRTTVGDFPLMMPVVNIAAIGAGGGSVVWVDPQGVLKVGPQSAGAAPGPVCYGRGGVEPTITDCYLAMGLLRPDGFLGGRMALDREAAVAALEGVADRVGYSGADRAGRIAEAALLVASAKMSTELFKAFAQRGLDPRGFTLIAYGGAGPTQANLLAEEVRLPRILIPLSPGTLCALGAILADLKRDYVRTIRRTLNDADIAAFLQRSAAGLEREARAWLAEEGDVVGAARLVWSADLRYANEAQDVTVPIPEAAAPRGDVAAIAEAYHAAHEAIYSFREPQATIELTTLRAQVVGPMSPVEIPVLDAGAGAAEAIGSREVFTGGRWVAAAVYRRQDLHDGDALAGPALIEQDDTTVWILPGWRGTVDARGVVALERGA